jgi:serine/threonine protein kinase
LHYGAQAVIDLISGKYEVLAVLGRGGMSDVYLAMSRGPAGFNKLVVVKELRPALAQDADHFSMFMSEARLGARLAHPSVVQVYEVGDDGGRHFITMEYLEGQPLHRIVSKVGGEAGLSTALYLRVLVDVLSGLHYAHELTDYDGTPLGVVHRDVSPHNVFVTYDGRVKLVDFGIAKGLDASFETRSGVVKGKIAYMSPEQATGVVVDRRSDVYSVGVMIWEAVTGTRLFQGMNEVSIIANLLSGEAPSPRTVRADVPEVLDALCKRVLSRDPDARHQTAEELRSDVLRAMSATGMDASLADLGRIVSEQFGEERAQLRDRIAAHRRRSSHRDEAPRISSSPDSNDRLGGETPLEFGTATGSVRAGSGRTAADTASNGRDVPTIPPPARRRRRRALGTAFAIAAVVISAPLLLWSRQSVDAALPSSPVTVIQQPARSPVDCNVEHKALVEVSGDIERNAVLGCDKDYLLKFNVFVRPGVTLTIEKGTKIVGDSDTKAALVVQPGARLVAEGTPESPIVFTSERMSEQRRPGDWGGVIVLGNAPTNLTDERGQSRRGHVEGITFGGEYGGTDENDDSGVIRYVRIEYAGTELAPGNEINGLTLAGVGRKTRIDHVEVRQVTDDCFEFFGGTVDAKYLVCQHGGDDGFDWDLGYRGRLQFLLFQQGHQAESGSNGFEGDNDPNASRNEPRSAPQIFNATLCGWGSESQGEQYGILARRRTAGRIANSAFYGFDAGVDLRDADSALEVVGSTFFGPSKQALAYAEAPGGGGPNDDDDNGLDEVKYLLELERGNANTPVEIRACLDPDHPSFVAAAASTPLSPPEDGFFDPSAAFAGAVRDDKDGWASAPWIVWSSH